MGTVETPALGTSQQTQCATGNGSLLRTLVFEASARGGLPGNDNAGMNASRSDREVIPRRAYYEDAFLCIENCFAVRGYCGGAERCLGQAR